MPVEAVNYISDLNTAWPLGTGEPKSLGDNHIRNIKLAVKQTFPNLNAAVDSTPAQLNRLNSLAALSVLGVTGNVDAAPAAIAAGTDGHVLRRNGAAVAFGRVENLGIRQGAAVSVIGRSANSLGDVADIAAAANDRILRRVGDVLDFGQTTEGMFAANTVPDSAFKYVQTAAEIAAVVVPTNGQRVPGDARRYGWSAANTGAQNATALANAALVWVNGGPSITLPEGTFALSQFVVPAGRGLIIAGQGPTKTVLQHSAAGSMFTLGADDIQLFSLRDMKIEPSATTTKLLDWSGDWQAYGFEFHNLELHQGASGNTTCIAFQIVGGTNAATHQKHYFKWFGAKIFGMGTGIKLDGSVGAAANDFRGYGIQIQGTTGDGIWIKQSGCNLIHASIENCGDGGVSTYNFRITGAISSENTFVGRLENTIVPANLVYSIDPAAGVSNRVFATLTATPANYNTVMAPLGNMLFDNGKEISHIERRERGLTRKISDALTDYIARWMLPTDTMGGFGRFGIRTDGRLSWATGVNPADWDTHLERVSVGGLQARGGVANRMSNSGTLSGAVTPDLSGGWTRRIVLGGNVTINLPTNPPAGGGVVRFVFIQDGTGGWTVTFNAAFKLAGSAYVMTVTANRRDVITFVYSDTDATYQEVSRSQNQT